MDNPEVNHHEVTSEMAERKSPQIVLSISEKVKQELDEVCDWLEIPVATYCRQIIEQHHRSMDFTLLLDRVHESKRKKNRQN